MGNDNTSGSLVVAAANADSETLPNENHKPMEQVSDGNQNNTECPLENGQLTMSVPTETDSELVKEMTAHLIEAYFKFRGQLVQLLKNQEKPRVPKNLFDDVESQVSFESCDDDSGGNINIFLCIIAGLQSAGGTQSTT